MRQLFILVTFVVVSCVAGAAELVVAQISPFTGPLSVNGIANYEGAKACVNEANDQGGVNGNTLKLIREDDQYKPQETIRLLREVAARDKPIAFLNIVGSANVGAVLKEGTLEDLRIPVVGVTPGADILRNPGSSWIFHVHASDSAQLRKIMTHLKTIGLNRVAVVYQDIPFGHGGLHFIESFAASLDMTIAGRFAVPSAADDLSAQAAQLSKLNAQAYISILVPNSGAALVRDLRKRGDKTMIYGMSYVPVKVIVDKAGPSSSAGIGLAQVTPNAFSRSTGLARRFHEAMDKYSAADVPHSQLHLIGYLACRVLVEGLRHTSGTPTPQALKLSLQKLRTDLGGYLVDFGGSNEGSKYVDIGVVTGDGRLVY